MSLRILASLAACLALSLAPARAADPDPGIEIVELSQGGPVYALPKAGPLRFDKFGQDGPEFTGTVTISGDYIFGYQEEHFADIGAYITFVPDAPSRALLPYWYERGQVRMLYFSNGDEAVSALADPARVAEVRAGKLKSTRGHATITIDRYKADVACDSAIYTATFLRVESQPQTIAQNEYAATGGCG